MFLGGKHVFDQPINAHQELAHGDDPIAFVAYPPPDSADVLRYSAKCDQTRAFSKGDYNVVFVGQIPKLLPLPYVPWALDLLLEEYGVKWVLQTQANGCAKAWTESEQHMDLLVARNKLLLFDVCGVWVARTAAQCDRMERYQACLHMRGTVDPRVPRHGIIIEKLRPPQPKAPASIHPPAAAFTAGNPEQFVPPSVVPGPGNFHSQPRPFAAPLTAGSANVLPSAARHGGTPEATRQPPVRPWGKAAAWDGGSARPFVPGPAPLATAAPSAQPQPPPKPIGL